jgi:hypothetical protein
MIDHDFDDEQIRDKAYQIWEKNKEKSEEENWNAAIKELKKQEKVSREGIKVENLLISNRITWMTTVNGLLFSTLGFSIGKSLNFWFFLTIVVIGLFASFSSFFALRCANKAIKIYLEKFVCSNEIKRQKNIAEGRIIGHRGDAWFHILQPETLLPIAFILGWLTISGLLLSQKLDKTIIDYPFTPTLSKSPPPAKVPNPTPAAQKTP